MSHTWICLNPACARPLPRQPNFCPYCGTRQQAAVPLHKPEPATAPVNSPAPTSAVASGNATSAANGAAAPGPAAAPLMSAATPLPPSAAAIGTSGPTGPTGPATPAAPPRPAPTKMPPFIAPPARRKPWWRWLLVLFIVLAVWNVIQKKDDPQQAKVAALQTLLDDCDLEQARREIPALKKLDADKAREWQGKIEQAKAGCDARRARERDWKTTVNQVNKALAEANFDKPAYDKQVGRLNWFNKTWKEDPASRELRQTLDARYARHLLDAAEQCRDQANWPCVRQRLTAWERLKQPDDNARAAKLREQLASSGSSASSASGGNADAAANKPSIPMMYPATTPTSNPAANPSTSPAAGKPGPASAAANSERQKTVQQLGQILADANEDMAIGNYQAAAGKMSVCLAMIDPGNVACLALKKRADRLNKEMLRCVNGGHEWIGDNCSK